ncbi:arabinan endo-1,5-alpha-L-arabinosidase [Sphingobacterium sp. Ka21]|uniref:Arabinan endo-1,5-alpha-L-arabinosidase n=1 Tax=Sphingobacterium pedocola TaxID=2082722 RepID=A0ABR9T9D4_9SPHI|nr:arabinan endo-1,5-alpha-L-arabinosidase [Sphingobacterium pedocola]
MFYSISASVNIFANPAELEYTNPVFTPILADPSVIRDPLTGYFYAYGTEDRWPSGTNQIVPIVRSQDLVNWSYVGNAFSNKPAWKPSGGVWAPDIAYVNGKYHLYYSMSIWDDPDPGIGLAIADYPAGPFSDYGKLFLSSEIGVPNSIDPFYYEDDGKKYLFWGSFDNTSEQGTHAVELTENGRSVRDMSQKFKIAAGDWEAVNIFKKNGYYYFFGSKGGCCDGANSTYRVLVARSTNLLGPYLDRNGNDIADRGNGTLVLQRNAQYAGPGHNAPIMTDNNGDDWILYHAIDVNNPMVNGVNQRVLMLDKIHWDTQGWPLVNNGYPSFESMLKPVF